MRYYIQINQDNIITDAITYEYENYIPYDTEYPLPVGFIGGWFKLEDGIVNEYPELKPNDSFNPANM